MHVFELWDVGIHCRNTWENMQTHRKAPDWILSQNLLALSQQCQPPQVITVLVHQITQIFQLVLLSSPDCYHLDVFVGQRFEAKQKTNKSAVIFWSLTAAFFSTSCMFYVSNQMIYFVPVYCHILLKIITIYMQNVNQHTGRQVLE